MPHSCPSYATTGRISPRGRTPSLRRSDGECIGVEMASDDVSVEVLLSRGRIGRSEAIALVLAALAVAAGAAAWVGADADRAPLAAAAVPAPPPAPATTFESRFGSAPSAAYPASDAV